MVEPVNMANPISRGFFGKIPSRGDFVGRGLPSSFVKPWETWVVEALKSSRSLLGETWSEAWMEAPVWRFALPGGTCGPDAALGLVLPSIDRVGRAWPLVIAAVFHGCQKTPDAARGKHFLDETEDAALDAIAADMEPDMRFGLA
jgi:type VI secretion system protein ImpM